MSEQDRGESTGESLRGELVRAAAEPMREWSEQLVARAREEGVALTGEGGLLATAQAQGWALVALDCAPEPTRPAGKQTANVLATFAPLERGLISTRVREALAFKRAEHSARDDLSSSPLLPFEPSLIAP